MASITVIIISESVAIAAKRDVIQNAHVPIAPRPNFAGCLNANPLQVTLGTVVDQKLRDRLALRCFQPKDLLKLKDHGQGELYPIAFVVALVLPAPSAGNVTTIAVFGADAGAHGENCTCSTAFGSVAPATVV